MIKRTVPLILVISIVYIPDLVRADDVRTTSTPVITDDLFMDSQPPTQTGPANNEPDFLPPVTGEQPSSPAGLKTDGGGGIHLGDLVAQGNSYLDIFEGIISGGISGMGGAIGSVVDLITGETTGIGNLLNDVASLANLVYRVVAIPDKLGGWWNSLINVVTGELSPCTNAAGLSGIAGPRVTFEPGWCIGTGIQDAVSDGDSNNGNPSNDDPFLDPVLGDAAPPAPPKDGDNPDGMGPTLGDQPGSPASRKSIGDALAASQGVMGLPDLMKLDEELETMNERGTDLFEINPVVQKIARRNLIHRGVTQVNAASLLSEPGQAAMKAQHEQAANTVTQSYALASASQNLNVTQDVMKQAIQLDAHQTLLLAGLLGHASGSRYDNNLGNLNLANISRSLDALSKEERVKRAILARRIQEISQRTGLW